MGPVAKGLADGLSGLITKYDLPNQLSVKGWLDLVEDLRDGFLAKVPTLNSLANEVGMDITPGSVLGDYITRVGLAIQATGNPAGVKMMIEYAERTLRDS